MRACKWPVAWPTLPPWQARHLADRWRPRSPPAERAADSRVTVRIQGSDLRVNTLAIGALDLRSAIDEPMAAAKVDATLAASRIAGAADINRLNATASGDRQTLAISLQASGAQTAANAAAKVELLGDDLVIGLTRFDGRYGAIPVTLAGPTRVHVAGPRVAIEPTNLRVGGGRLAVRGTLAPTASDLQLELAGLPLSLIDAFAPGTNLDGTLQAKLRIHGSMDAPLIDGTYNAAGLRLRRPEAALVPPLNVQGSGSLMGQQASIDARLTAAATNLTLKGKATLPRGAAPLSGTATIGGTMDLAPFAPLLGNDIRNVTGRLRPDLTVEIAGSRVTGNGSIDFSNGAVAMPQVGAAAERRRGAAGSPGRHPAGAAAQLPDGARRWRRGNRHHAAQRASRAWCPTSPSPAATPCWSAGRIWSPASRATSR